jgi:hypothetical protein
MGIFCTGKKEEKTIMQGFEAAKVQGKINGDELNNIIRKYKKAKKYMRSGVFAIKTMDGTEEYISSLMNESNDPSLVN